MKIDSVGTIQLIKPSPELLEMGMNSSFISSSTYPQFIYQIQGESGANNLLRVVCIEDTIKQKHDLVKFYECGVEFHDDRVTKDYMGYIIRNKEKIKKEYLVSKL